jgi:DNA-binding GntR family transcriptional regulator
VLPDAALPRHPGVATRAGAVAEELRRLIRAGELPAGTRLRQAEIAARFAVSTTPVREALTALAKEGYVLQDAHRGAVVFMPSAADLLENYDIRLGLEPRAAELAAARISAEELAEIEALHATMRTVGPADLPGYVRELNPRFHALICRAAGRPRLTELIAQLRDAAMVYTQLLVLRPQPPEYLAAAQDEHEAIVAALRARAPNRAAAAMRAHLQHSADQILGALEQTAPARAI